MTNGFDARDYWGGMPEFVAESQMPFRTIKVFLTQQPCPEGKSARFKPFVTIHFRKEDFAKNLAEVAEKLKQNILPGTQPRTLDTDEKGLAALLFNNEHTIAHHSTWYPPRPNVKHSRYAYRQEAGNVVNPIYPVYIISKGRWDFLLTARALERMGVPYTIVVEPKEYANYETALAGTYDDDYGGRKPFTLGVLHKAPENFSERGCGSIPVRNYCWDLAIKTGKARHWLMDDTIPTFYRLNRNMHIRVETGAIFRAAEIFADKHENVALAGFQNNQFAMAKMPWPPFFLNVKVFSCTLIKNDLRLTDGLSEEEIKDSNGRWIGRYNEDHNLCIRAMKAGWCTVCFITFNSEKVETGIIKGGNEELYAGDPQSTDGGRYKMALSLFKQHPDEVKVSWRFNRWQAVVNYPACVEIGKKARPSGCVLKLRDGVQLPTGNNEYGMVLCERATGGGQKSNFFRHK